MTLLEATRSRPPIRIRRDIDIHRLKGAVRTVEEAFPGYSKSQPSSLEDGVSRVRSAMETWDWSSVTIGHVALVTHAVFSEAYESDRALGDFIRREAAVTTVSAVLQAMGEAYVEAWERSSETTVFLSKLLAEKVESLPHRWSYLFKTLSGLLDPIDAPRLLAAEMVAAENPYRWLREKGIAAPHSGKLMLATYYEWLAALPTVKTVAGVESIFAWTNPVEEAPIGQDQAATAIDKLLSPWVSEMPDADLRQHLLDRILELYGDPRNTRQDFWALVDPKSRQVLIRWLAGRSMDALLAIITKSTANHMWPPRHHFWKGLYERGLIDEAWVALSKSAFMDAEKMYRETGDITYRMTGRQTSSSRRETCLLIMRIGSRIVLEGSHDYRVHIFADADPKAPELYAAEYNAESLILPQNDRSTRSHDAYGHWRKWVTERLFR